MTDQAFSFLVAGGMVLVLAVLLWPRARRDQPHASARPRARSSRAELRDWIKQHMPELDAELGPLSLDQVRIRLNAITGCTVMPNDSVELSCAVFLAALQAQHERRAED